MSPDNFTHLFPTTKPATACFMLPVNPVPRQDLIASLETATLGRSQKPIPIKGIMQGFIERAHPLPSRTRKEDAGLVNEICDLESFPVEWNRRSQFGRGTPILEQLTATIENDRFIVAFGQCRGDGTQSITEIDIVAVEPPQDRSPGSLKPLVNRLGLPVVRFAAPESKLFFPSSDHRDALIRATTIHYQIFQIRVILTEYAV
jgi:hypothetical protein